MLVCQLPFLDYIYDREIVVGEHVVGQEKDCIRNRHSGKCLDVGLPPIQKHEVAKVILHENWKPSNFREGFDIALVRIVKSIVLFYVSNLMTCVRPGRSLRLFLKFNYFESNLLNKILINFRMIIRYLKLYQFVYHGMMEIQRWIIYARKIQINIQQLQGGENLPIIFLKYSKAIRNMLLLQGLYKKCLFQYKITRNARKHIDA